MRIKEPLAEWLLGWLELQLGCGRGFDHLDGLGTGRLRQASDSFSHERGAVGNRFVQTRIADHRKSDVRGLRRGADAVGGRWRLVRRLSITPAVLVTAVLALLLIAYVFIGGGRENNDRAPHCAASQALDQVKAELFRRAGQVRGATDTEFAKVANYSVVRAPSRMVRRHYRKSDKVTCTGSIVLDLPPGVAVAGGRRSLSSTVGYDLEPAGGRTRLLTLSKADAIVIPLATLFQSSRAADQANAPTPPSAEESNAPETTRLEPDPTTKPQVVRPVAPPAAAPPERSPTATPSQPAQAGPITRPESGSKPTVTPRAPAPPPIATARPSFNCRYARTRGEVAVCGNAGLASLDRQMAAQFFSALSVARPGQRAILQRSRNRFLRYRDSCTSEACVADAYRARMREISEIMAGAW